jgi:hypothetical protein
VVDNSFWNVTNPQLLVRVSSRISKGQGYQGLLRKRAGSSFGQKGKKEKLEKSTEFHYF